MRQCPGLKLHPEQIDTNIVIFHVDPKLGTAEQFAARLEAAGVLTYDISAQSMRMVTHLDVRREDVQRAADIIQQTTNR